MDAAFKDRPAAGRELVRQLRKYAGRDGLLVLGLPRGGVPVAFEVAVGLRAPLDVFLVRKLGVPGQEELAMGAIASGGVRVLNEEVVSAAEASPDAIDAVIRREEEELARRERSYRDGRPAPDPAGRPVVLVDDGLATGSTMRAATRRFASCSSSPPLAAPPSRCAGDRRRPAGRSSARTDAGPPRAGAAGRRRRSSEPGRPRGPRPARGTSHSSGVLCATRAARRGPRGM